MLPSFEGETGMVDISASKPDKCKAGEMVLPFLQGTRVHHQCVRVPPCLLPARQTVLAFSTKVQNMTQPPSFLRHVLLCSSVCYSAAHT